MLHSSIINWLQNNILTNFLVDITIIKSLFILIACWKIDIVKLVK